MYEGIDQYRFFGTHAIRADELVTFGFFPRIVDVLMVAPVVGFEYGRTAERNTQDDADKSVFLKQLKDANGRLELNYKAIMLLDKGYTPDADERFRKAFQVMPESRDKADLDHYEQYVRGGVDFLHEKLIGSGNTSTERLADLLDLVESFADRYSGEADF